MKKLPRLLLISLCLTPILCLACNTLMDKTGKVLDGTAFAEKRVALYRTVEKEGKVPIMEIAVVQNKAGEQSLIITLGKFPAIKIRARMQGDVFDGSTDPEAPENFTLKSLDYLSGNTSGWNEYSTELIGSGKFGGGSSGATNSSHAEFKLNPEIEEVQLLQGRIRRFDTRIVGNEALTSLQHRRDRIMVLAEWMHECEGVPEQFERNDFDRYWKPVLFPELVAKKNRPIDWQQDGDPRVTAEDIRWNAGYTERNFPEELRSIRDSGTMLRDWEEAFEWLYVEYHWDEILALLTQETVLYKKK